MDRKINDILNSFSCEKFLEKANKFREICNNIPVWKVVRVGEKTYNYIPLPVTDGPLEKGIMEDLSYVLAKGLLDCEIDLNKVWAVTEGDRGAGPLLQAFQTITGVNIHWANWYDESTVKAFRNDMAAEEMSPQFAMGSSLRPGFYLPGEIKKAMEKSGVVIIEDVISTGTTLLTLKTILDRAGIPVRAIACGVEKVDYKGVEKLKKYIQHIPIITVARIKIRNLTEKEKILFGYNQNITGMTQVEGPLNVPYYFI